jgi:preprotein translocase subunit SecE
MPDGVKWFVTILLVASAIGGFYYFADQSLLLRVIALLIVFGASGAVALQTNKGQIVWGVAKEARTEVRKVVWPTRKETVQTTMIVIAMVFIVAMILWAVDGILGAIMRRLLGHGG